MILNNMKKLINIFLKKKLSHERLVIEEERVLGLIIFDFLDHSSY